MVKDNKDEASCSICGKVLKTPGSSTSGLRDHLTKVHEIVPEPITQPNSKPKFMEGDIYLVRPQCSKKDKACGGQKSFIWKYMTKESKDEAKCSICGKVLSTPKGTTTSAREHLNRIHDIIG